MISPNPEEAQPSDEIASRIRRNRTKVSRTIDEIGEQLLPENLMESIVDDATGKAIDSLRSGLMKVAKSAENSVKKNPLPLALILGGAALWAFSTGKKNGSANISKSPRNSPVTPSSPR